MPQSTNNGDRARFTSGPWKFVKDLNAYGQQGPDAPILGTVTMGGTWHIAVLPSDIKEAEANARLIAAAPDGYDAAAFAAEIIRMLVAQLATFGVEPACNAQGAIDKLEAFLAKARPEQSHD